MNILVLSLLSIGLYTFGTFHQTLIYLRKTQNKPFISMLIGCTAVFSHLIITSQQIFTNNEIILSFFNTVSLVACFVSVYLFVNVFPAISFSALSLIQSLSVVDAACLCPMLIAVFHPLLIILEPAFS